MGEDHKNFKDHPFDDAEERQRIRMSEDRHTKLWRFFGPIVRVLEDWKYFAAVIVIVIWWNGADISAAIKALSVGKGP